MIVSAASACWLGATTTATCTASQRLRNHSPDGFEFGYGGSGPAQLALAILLDCTGDAEVAQRWYQDFKWRFVAHWTGDKAEITAAAIADFLHAAQAEDRAFDALALPGAEGGDHG